ncbi:FecR family protein [Marinilongibacter aquaticus]|uniref:FecR family protein n=1 Tax=Marinilongibacter aquaticus TaxID=2975157 RepID=UPI0021BDA092|nr:FecR family protein [Marinilongibacter aquaticus]UBM60593.1 FecR family protein [Marinilongibacter aquaticus]
MNPFDYKKFFAKYLRAEHTEKEHTAFLKWFGQLSEDEKVLVMEAFQSLSKGRKWPETPEMDRWSQAIESRIDALEGAEKEPFLPIRKFWKPLPWVAAAAAVFVAVYMFLPKASLENKLTAKAEISKALEKEQFAVPEKAAVLMLNNGAVYTLSESSINEINEEGVSLEKGNDGFFLFQNTAASTNSQTQLVRTPASGQVNIQLPDGTRVWLNALSSISFPSQFSEGPRIVDLEGEAYFEVSKLNVNGVRKPFRVRTGRQEIEVLGTHFNVNSYADEDAIKTTLLEGRIVVHVKQAQVNAKETQVQLLPGQQSVLTKNETLLKVENVDSQMAVSWKEGFFNFKETEIREVMRQLARWYDIEIEYQGEVKHERFTGYLPKSMNLETLLQILEEGGGVKLEYENRKLHVRTI